MKLAPHSLRAFTLFVFLAATLASTSLPAHAQSCETSGELDDATRAAITAAGQRYFDMASKGDTASLRQNSIPSLVSAFSEIESTVKGYQPDLAGTQPVVKSVFLLDATGPAPLPHAEFLCGVFGKGGQTADSAVFYLDNLPPSKYAVVLIDVNSAKGRIMFSPVLELVGADWKLGGLYIKQAEIAGHDSDWFLARAREFKAKGQMHNAWFYYRATRNLISPLNFMSTQATDRLYTESNSLQPADLPGGGKTVDLTAGTKTYKVTAVFPEALGNDLDLIVRYQNADAANSNLAYADNIAVIHAIVAMYPEVRDAFDGVVARAQDAAGHDYGTLMAMKDIK